MKEMQQANSSIDERLEKIESALREQQKTLDGVSRDTERIKKYIFWGRMLNVFYLLLVFAPIVLAMLYLPPILRQLSQAYQEVLPSRGSAGNTLQGMQKLLQELKKP